MKWKDFKRTLNEQVDARLTPPSDRVLSEKIVVHDETNDKIAASNAAPRRKTRRAAGGAGRARLIYGGIAAAAAVVMIVACALIPAALRPGTPFEPIQTGITCMTVDVNPSVEMVVAADGTVDKLIARNRDADVLLADRAFERYEGMSADECVALIVRTSAELGFIDVTDTQNAKGVRLVAAGENDAYTADILNDSKRRVNEFFVQNGVYGVVYAKQQNAAEFVASSQSGASDLKQLADALRAVPSADYRREAEQLNGADRDALEQAYLGEAVQEFFSDFLEDFIDDHFEWIEEGSEIAEALADVEKLNDKIVRHPANPGLIAKSYWDVADMPVDDEKWNELIDEIAEELEDLKEEYGVEIASYADFCVQKLRYEQYDVLQKALDRLDDLDARDVSVVNEFLDAVAEIAPRQAAELRKIFDGMLTQIPQSVEDWVDRTEKKIKNKYDERRQRYGASLDDRVEMSEDEYEDWLESLLDAYGDDWDALWESLQK